MRDTVTGIKSIILRLGSMSLAIVLLSVLALASIIGTVLIQNQQQADYLTQFGPLWYAIFKNLGLFDMYHNWWFLSLLGFLMLSLSVCLWRHVPRMLKDMRSHKIIIADKSLQRFHHLHHWQLRGQQPKDLLPHIVNQLIGWRLKTAEENGRTYVRADKGHLHKFGYILVHSAILIILVGGLMSVQLGFRGNMSVPEGQMGSKISFLKGTETDSLEMPFQVRCNSFNIDFFPTGAPKEFRSNLTIIDGGKEVLTSDIIVNDPLFYKGVYIYQASFGDGGSDITLDMFHMDGTQRISQVRGTIYETYTDETSGISLEFTNFSPFNVENMANAGEPKQFQNLGPAVEFIVRGPGLKPAKIKSFMNPLLIDGKNMGSFMLVSLSGDAAEYEPLYLGIDLTNPREWQLFHAFVKQLKMRPKGNDPQANLEAFKSALKDVFGEEKPTGLPEMGAHIIQGMRLLTSLPWPFIPILADYDQVYYTGLQLARDPGMNVVWIGSAILVLGLCVMFYMPHRKIWLILEPGDKTLRISLGGMTNRNSIGFEQEFHALLTGMEQVFQLTGKRSPT